MFRQDRTNPSTAVSNWKGRRDSKRGHPQTAVSNWLNGGLFGAAVIEATGGTSIIDVGGYRHHLFNSSSNFVVSANPGGQLVDILVHAGGGGANGVFGGGAGEIVNATGVAAPVATNSVVIGAGGAYNADGVDSSAMSTTATLGDKGDGTASRGGTSGSGNLGGTKDTMLSSSGGGGGGQGAAGSNGVWQGSQLRANGGPGGIGIPNIYNNYGSAPYVGMGYSGGGGGGGAGTYLGAYASYGGSAGYIGGGTGGSYSGGWQGGAAATASSGGGGGGDSWASGAETGTGAGGWVIIRYALDGS